MGLFWWDLRVSTWKRNPARAKMTLGGFDLPNRDEVVRKLRLGKIDLRVKFRLKGWQAFSDSLVLFSRIEPS